MLFSTLACSAVHGMIRLEKLISTNKCSGPHLLWHAGIFNNTLTISILDQFGAANSQIYTSRYGGPLYILYIQVRGSMVSGAVNIPLPGHIEVTHGEV